MESCLAHCETNDKELLLTSINNTRNDLNQLIEIRAKGAAIRSRTRWIEFGEKIQNIFRS